MQHGSTHDIVSFMQQLGYRDFAAAGPEEAKIEQFKRALKLTRPTSHANKPPKEKVQHSHECIMCIVTCVLCECCQFGLICASIPAV